MLRLNVKLEIENPCTIDLDRMPVVSNGFFCEQCSKNVIDMTDWNNNQIIEFFQINPDGICAKICRNKIDNLLSVELHNPPKKRLTSKLFTFLLSIVGWASITSNAQNRIPPQVEIFNNTEPKSNDTIIITGIVENNGSPLKEAKVDFMGKTYFTDTTGTYFISIHKSVIKNGIIQFSYPDLIIEKRSYNIGMGSTNYNIILYKPEPHHYAVAGGIRSNFFLPTNWNKNYIEVTNGMLDIKSMRELDTIAMLMKANPNFGMGIQGYFYKDSSKAKNNIRVIKNYLVDTQMIDAERIIINGLIKSTNKIEEKRVYLVPPTYE